MLYSIKESDSHRPHRTHRICVTKQRKSEEIKDLSRFIHKNWTFTAENAEYAENLFIPEILFIPPRFLCDLCDLCVLCG
jgi:hypothetical protein